MKIHPKKSILTLATVTFLASAGMTTASAGCLTGAAIGGVAGHVAGHGVLGAAAGCAVGHHEAEKKAKNAAQPQPNQAQPADNSAGHKS